MLLLQFTMFNVHCILYIVYCTLHTVHRKLCSAYCVLYTVHCALYTVFCTLYSVYCVLYSVQCSQFLATAQQKLTQPIDCRFAGGTIWANPSPHCEKVYIAKHCKVVKPTVTHFTKLKTTLKHIDTSHFSRPGKAMIFTQTFEIQMEEIFTEKITYKKNWSRNIRDFVVCTEKKKKQLY